MNSLPVSNQGAGDRSVWDGYRDSNGQPWRQHHDPRPSTTNTARERLCSTPPESLQGNQPCYIIYHFTDPDVWIMGWNILSDKTSGNLQEGHITILQASWSVSWCLFTCHSNNIINYMTTPPWLHDIVCIISMVTAAIPMATVLISRTTCYFDRIYSACNSV